LLVSSGQRVAIADCHAPVFPAQLAERNALGAAMVLKITKKRHGK
jgi:hypothetical protein